MHALSAFLIGLLFGLGLIVSGMTDPFKVIGFLDIAGPWDPSLALVMAAAVAISVVGFRVAGRRAAPLLGGAMRLPAAGDADRALVLGSVVFGIGWGLAGFCPGPALTAVGAGYSKAAVFVAAMLAGMALFEIAQRYRDPSEKQPATE